MWRENMVCPKCQSENVKIETASNVKSRGGTVPLWYWWSIICPMIDFALCCCIIGFFGFTIHHMLKRSAKKTKTEIETYAVCQDCGNTWNIK